MSKSAITEKSAVVITLPEKTEKAGSRGDKRFNRVNKRGLDCIGTLLVPMNGQEVPVPVNLKVLGHQDGKTLVGFVSTSPVPSQFFIGNPSEADLEVWFDLSTVNESDGPDLRHARIVDRETLSGLISDAIANGAVRDTTKPSVFRFTYPKDSKGFKAGATGFVAESILPDNPLDSPSEFRVTNARTKKE